MLKKLRISDVHKFNPFEPHFYDNLRGWVKINNQTKSRFPINLFIAISKKIEKLNDYSFSSIFLSNIKGRVNPNPLNQKVGQQDNFEHRKALDLIYHIDTPLPFKLCTCM